MPMRRSPMSLKNIALKTVTLNFEMICYGSKYSKGTKELAHYIHTEGFKKIEGPFADWPSTLLQEIVAALYRHRCGHQHLLHCAIQPQLTHCSILQHGSIHGAMKLIQGRCGKSLKSLELSHCKNVPPGFFSEFFRTFTNITNLSVLESLVDDSDLISIGKYMPLLVEFNAGGTWITNDGIKYLCCDEEQQTWGGNGLANRCPRLVILNVTRTRVSKAGVALFLAYHPSVVRIEHEESFHGLNYERRRPRQPDEKKFTCKLKSLVTSSMSLDPEDFNFAIDSCPMLEEIIILSTGLVNENLYKLMNLTRLTVLHLGNKNAQSFNFYEGLAPVLTECGQSLKKMVLEDFTEVDIQMIGVACPHLQHLALSGTTAYAPVAHVQPGLFRKLEKLELWNRDNRWGSPDCFQFAICSQSLKQLLMYSDINFLLLYKVDTITDKLFQEIFDFNPMRNLNNLVFDHCQGITSATLWKVLELPNNLSVLRCWHCGGVPSATRDEIKDLVKEENLMVYWEWYAYIENEDELAAARAAAALIDWGSDDEEDE